MNYKNIIIIILVLLLAGCNEYGLNEKSINQPSLLKYKNSGFALVYDESLIKKKKISKKIYTRGLLIFHKNLKKNSFVKITNPINEKTIIAKVVSNKVVFSDFYNSVITDRIVEELSLNTKEPYIDLVLISQNSTFIAKKAKMFDEEKQVAEKAPVEGISINDLSLNKKKNKKIQKKDKFNYIIKIADFYYENTAIMMQKRIKDELNLNSSKISKISNTNFRVYLGPFDNLESLKNAFDGITPLNFENIEIIKL